MILQTVTVTGVDNHRQQKLSEPWSVSMYHHIFHQGQLALNPVVVWG